MSDARDVIEAAVYAALGCTDVRKVDTFPAASKQIADFVLHELERSGLCVGPKGARVLFNPVGQRFGRLVVSKELPRRKNRQGTPIRRWECACDCGKIIKVLQSQISGKRAIQSCGCVRAEKLGDFSRTHGFAGRETRPPEYNVWQSMKRRCYSPNDSEYHNYGGRGIEICERWKSSFVSFYEDMGSRPSDAHSIDRIDVNGNYEPNNCRWATWKEQRANQRRAA
jgi:hypothetical protein